MTESFEDFQHGKRTELFVRIVLEPWKINFFFLNELGILFCELRFHFSRTIFLPGDARTKRFVPVKRFVLQLIQLTKLTDTKITAKITKEL